MKNERKYNRKVMIAKKPIFSHNRGPNHYGYTPRGSHRTIRRVYQTKQRSKEIMRNYLMRYILYTVKPRVIKYRDHLSVSLKMKSPKVNVVSSYPKGTGIGRFAINLHNLGSASKFFNFNYSRNNFNKNQGYSYLEYYKPPYFPRITYMYSFVAPTIWKKIIVNSEFVHFTSPDFFHLAKYNEGAFGTIHDMYAFEDQTKNQMSFIYRAALRLDYKYSNYLKGLTAVSNVTAKTFSRYFPTIKPVVIHNWTSDLVTARDKLTSRALLNLPKKKFIILNVSSNSRNKNLYFLNNVLEKVKNDFLYIHVGPDPNYKLSSNKILNVKYIKDDFEMALYYNSADLYVAPSLQDGFNFPIIEAVNSRLPVIASNIDIFKEVLKNSPYLIDPSSSNQWVEIIELFANDPSVAYSLLEWYKENIGNYYREERARNDFYKFYKTFGAID